MEMITLTINGQTVQAPKNATILEAARSAGIHIPTLCYHSELAPEGACQIVCRRSYRSAYACSLLCLSCCRRYGSENEYG